jgi:hypothetical protein
MKKIFFIALAIIAIATVHAQTQKGKIVIGGQINLSGNNDYSVDTLNSYEYSSFGFQISPEAGYFISDHLAIGGSLIFGISNYSTTYKNPGQTPSKLKFETNSTNYGVGVFARYYLKLTDKFYFCATGEAAYRYEPQKVKYTYNDPDYIYPTNNPSTQKIHRNTFSVRIAPGLTYFITPKLGIQGSFGNLRYSNSTSKNTSLNFDNHDNSESYGINLGLSSLYLGLNYYF